MSIPTGNTPGNIPGNIPIDATPTEITTTGAEETTPLPATEQPVQDTTESVKQPSQDTATTSYEASSQFPVLEKQSETTTETAEGEGAESAEGAEQSEGNEQVDETPDSTKDEGGGGGTGDGNTDSDSGSSSGGSSGGDNSNNEAVAARTSTTDGTSRTVASGTTPGVGAETVVTADSNAPAGISGAQGAGAATPVQEGDSTLISEEAYLRALDPTGTAVITESGLFAPPTSPAQFFSNADKMLNEITDMAVKFAASLPEGLEKSRFVDYLKLIQDALSQFGQLLRELQMHDSKGAVDRSKAALEASLAKIEKQREEQAEMARKAEEAAKKAKLMQALAPLFIILMIFLLPLLLPLMIGIMMPLIVMVMALIVAEIVDQCATAAGVKPFAIKALADALMAVVEFLVDISATAMNFSDEARRTAKLVFKMIVVALVLVVSTLVAPLAILGGGISALMSFLSATKVIKNAAMASGMEESEAEKVDMYVGIAIGAIAAIATFGLALVMPGAQGGIIASVANAAKSVLKAAFDLIIKILNVVVNLIDKVGSKTAQIIKAVLKAVFDPEMLLQLTMMGVQTTSAVITYKQQSLLAEIAIIHGRMDSEIELKDATIQMLKKMIKQLLDGLTGIGDDMAAVAQSLKKTHTGVSEITTNLFA